MTDNFEIEKEKALKKAAYAKEMQEQWKHRQQRAMARINSMTRKARTRRLIQKGAVLEQWQAEGNGLKFVPEAPRVTKKDDPKGYQAYLDHRDYVRKKEDMSEKITPEESSAWLKSMLRDAHEYNHLLDLLKSSVSVKNDGYMLNWSSPSYKELAQIISKAAPTSNPDEIPFS